MLYRYLPAGVRFLTPLGTVADPRLTDWRDGVARLRAGSAERVLAPLVDRLAPGRRVLLVMPVYRRPLAGAVEPGGARSARASGAPGCAPTRACARSAARRARPSRRRRSGVRTQLFEVR